MYSHPDIVEKEKSNRSFIFFVSILLVAGCGYLDYISGYQIGFSIFYLIPILTATWWVGRVGGFVLSIASAVAIFLADLLSGRPYSHFLIGYWNSFMTLCFFVIITLMLDFLKGRLEYEKTLARVDPLTMAPNRRYFNDAAGMAIDQLARYGHPFSMAYIDIDDFKQVNDSFGHSAGDKLLKDVARTITVNIRTSDVVARLGGDEFAVLMPETAEKAAWDSITRVKNKLSEMENKQNKVTFSVGVVTYLKPPDTIEELIDKADKLMYKVKKAGKNLIRAEISGDKL